MAELDNIYATEDDTEESGGLPPEIAALFASTSSELEGNLAEGPLDETEEARVPFWASGHAKLNMDKKLGLDKKESYLTSVESAKEGDTAGAAAAKLIETGADEQAQTRSQAIAQALIAITPMLIGAAIKGKKGAAVGAAAGGAGVGLMEQQRLLREKEQREEQRDLKKLGIQQQGQLAKSLISQAGQEARSDKAFERAKELIQFREQIKGRSGDEPVPEFLKPLAQKILDIYLPGQKADDVNLKTFDRLTDAGNLMERHVGESGREALRTADLASREIPGTSIAEGYVPPSRDTKEASLLKHTRGKVSYLASELSASVKKDDFQLWSPRPSNQEAYDRQQSLIAQLVDEIKKAEGYGANFTGWELGLALSRIGSRYATELNAGQFDLVGKAVAQQVKQDTFANNLASFQKGFDVGALGRMATLGYYLDGVNYKDLQNKAPSVFTDSTMRGARLDKNGVASPNPWYRENFGMARGRAPTEEQAAPKEIIVKGRTFALQPNGKYREVK